MLVSLYHLNRKMFFIPIFTRAHTVLFPMEPEVFAHVVMVKDSYLQMGEKIKGKT